jgi:leader peptidase (prepilin peptidase) / N-methyltransferase
MSVFWIILGLVIGSFLNVLVIRVNEEENFNSFLKGIVMGRSRCLLCHKEIKWYDNIPLLSYLILGGKCRHCKKSISIQYPVIELSTGMIWLLVWLLGGQYWFFGGLGGYLFTVSTYTLLLGLLVSDLRYMTLPDIFIYPLTIGFLLYRGLEFWGDWKTLVFYFISALGASLFFYIIWAVTRGRGMGFGDVEYAVPMGLMLGFPAVILGLMIAFISGGIIGVLAIFSKQKKLTSQIPFGPFLIFGTVVAIIWGKQIIWSYVGWWI